MPSLRDLFDLNLFDKMLREKFIRVQSHPLYPYQIANYTEKAQFEKKWNEVTKQCRGLIFDNCGNPVIARPFDKFFNYGEWGYIDDSYRKSHCVVTDKLDGSLGILYPHPGMQGHRAKGWSIATRGSFTSTQAIHATEVLQNIYGDWVPDPDFTYLFEIIYPENRIVCDYSQLDDLVYLGRRSIDYGFTSPPDNDYWPGPRAEILDLPDFASALAAQPRKGKEGMVVHFTQKDERLKLKQADYVALHRLVTGLNERRVWESLAGGLSDNDVLMPLPEEFREWAGAVIQTLRNQHHKLYWRIQEDFREVIASLPAFESRKDFALAATKRKYPAYLFKLYDKRDIADDIWKELKPDFRQGPWSQSEDTA